MDAVNKLPGVQVYDEAPLADNVVVCPAQIVNVFAVVTVGVLTTVTTAVLLPVQDPDVPETV